MQKPLIKKISGREIIDSRGTPTLEVTVVLEDGAVGIASVPSGASTGRYEAHERRDGDPARFGGKGVLRVAMDVGACISPALCGMNAAEQADVDARLLSLDGTPDKSRLGANATLAVSLAVARAAAAHYHLPLFRYLGGAAAHRLPVPMMNILNGGAHADNNVDVQEFMILPVGAKSFSEGLRWGCEITRSLGRLLRRRGLSTTVGDEGGFAPDLENDEAALSLIVEAVRDVGLDTQRVKLALDAAASEWHGEEGYTLPKRGRRLTAEALCDEWADLAARYPILSLEDGLGEDDFPGWQQMTKRLGSSMLLVGDDLFVTNRGRLADGIRLGAGNAILIKPNQIGTLTETLQVIALAKEAGYRFILSHRSGETTDTTIADIAVATGAPLIKAGAPCRGERVAKYNRLLSIEQSLGDAATYGL